VALNVTVNVTLPRSGVKLSLNSVYGWLVILSRINSDFPLSLTNQAYQNGFGDIASNFWLGLERVYQLTNSAVNGGLTYRLRFELLSASDHR
jgi:Fibrinogen beta and gamma chains, C-terminal globular domain